MTLWDLILSGVLPMDTAIILLRMFLGFGIALLVAISMGYLLAGFSRILRKLSTRCCRYGQLNPWPFFHLAIIFLSIGECSIVATVFIYQLWPVLYNTVTGIKNVDPTYQNCKICKARGVEIF